MQAVPKRQDYSLLSIAYRGAGFKLREIPARLIERVDAECDADAMLVASEFRNAVPVARSHIPEVTLKSLRALEIERTDQPFPRSSISRRPEPNVVIRISSSRSMPCLPARRPSSVAATAAVRQHMMPPRA